MVDACVALNAATENNDSTNLEALLSIVKRKCRDQVEIILETAALRMLNSHAGGALVSLRLDPSSTWRGTAPRGTEQGPLSRRVGIASRLFDELSVG
jgi:hypothetical protein